MSRAPASNRITCCITRMPTIAVGELFRTHYTTPRLPAAISVASTGIKENHMRVIPRTQQSYRGSCLGTTLPKLTTRSLATIHGASTGLQYNHMQEAIPIAAGKLLWNNTPRQQDCSRLFMSRVPESKRITCVHHQDGNNRIGEAVVGQHSPTTRSLATTYVASTGTKTKHHACTTKKVTIVAGEAVSNDAPRQQHRSRLFMSRVPASRIACVQYQGTNNRSGEDVVEQHSRTTRLLATNCFLLSGVPASNRLICVHNQEATVVMGKPLWNDAPQQHA